jgi:hypothetical protein
LESLALCPFHKPSVFNADDNILKLHVHTSMTVDRKELLELYKMAIETDRYELDLGWKLVQFFTVLNSGLLSLGFTILGSDQISPKYYVTPIFIIVIVISLIARDARRRYHEHSLRASYKKTLIENELGLYDPLKEYTYQKHNMAITTSAKTDPVSEILANPEEYIQKSILKRGTVPFYHAVVFVILMAIGVAGFFISIL